MFNPPVVTVTNRHRQCTISRKNKNYKYNKIQIQLFVSEASTAAKLRTTAVYFDSANATSRAEPWTSRRIGVCGPGLRWLSRGMFCLNGWGEGRWGRRVTLGEKWSRKLAFKEVGWLGLEIAELVYRLNRNVTVSRGRHRDDVCWVFTVFYRVSAGVSQHDHLSAQQCEWDQSVVQCLLICCSQQVQSHHIFHLLKRVCVCINMGVYLLSEVHSFDFTIRHNLNLTETLSKIVAFTGNSLKFQARRLSDIIHGAGHKKGRTGGKV